MLAFTSFTFVLDGRTGSGVSSRVQAEGCERITASDLSTSHVAQELALPATVLRRWGRDLAAPAPEPAPDPACGGPVAG